MVNVNVDTLKAKVNFINTKNLAQRGYDMVTLMEDLCPIRGSGAVCALYHKTSIEDALSFITYMKDKGDDTGVEDLTFGSLHLTQVQGKWGAQNNLVRSWVEVNPNELANMYVKAFERW